MNQPKVAIYVRVSTNEQAEEGISLQAQPASVLKKLDEQFGVGSYSYEVFVDEGKSGTLGPLPWASTKARKDRTGLWNMLQGLKADKFTHVAAFRLDRIYRNKLGSIGLYSEIMRPKGIKFVLVADQFDESLSGRLTQGILAEVAEFQREQISENIRQTMAFRREQGYCLGKASYGWVREKREDCEGRRTNIIPDPETRDIVIRIKDLYLSGESELMIARKLNSENIPTPKGPGPWAQGTVNRILKGPIYAGLVPDGKGGLMRGLHYEHRFYEEFEFELIKAKQARCANRLKGVQHSQPFRLFAGLAFCGACGRKLSSNYHHHSPSYGCDRTRSTATGSHVYIAARVIERHVVGLLSSMAGSEVIEKEIEARLLDVILKDQGNSAKRSQQIKRVLSELDRKIGSVLEALEDKVIPHEIARQRLEVHGKDKAALIAEQAEIEAAGSEMASKAEHVRLALLAVKNFGDVWAHLEDAEKREALQHVIEYIKVHAVEDRKWLEVKHILADEPVEIEVLRGVERYKTNKPDGIASLTPRELAALKHTLDGCSIYEAASLMGVSYSGAYGTMRMAMQRLGVESFSAAAKKAEPMIRRIEADLPLLGKRKAPKKSGNKHLIVMEYQVICLAADGQSTAKIAARTGIDLERTEALLNNGLRKLEATTPKSALKMIERDPSLLPYGLARPAGAK